MIKREFSLEIFRFFPPHFSLIQPACLVNFQKSIQPARLFQTACLLGTLEYPVPKTKYTYKDLCCANLVPDVNCEPADSSLSLYT